MCQIDIINFYEDSFNVMDIIKNEEFFCFIWRELEKSLVFRCPVLMRGKKLMGSYCHAIKSLTYFISAHRAPRGVLERTKKILKTFGVVKSWYRYLLQKLRPKYREENKTLRRIKYWCFGIFLIINSYERNL